MNTTETIDVIRLIGEYITLGGTVFALAFSFRQYQNAQQWKRAEWVAQEIKAIFADPMVENTLKMIDWDGREILLFPNNPIPSKQYVLVSHEDVKNALRIHDSESTFTRAEAGIRDSFDRFFEGVERLSHYVESGLVTVNEVQIFLEYWSEKIIKGDMSSEIILYMEKYGYLGSKKLLDQIYRHSKR